MPVTFTKSNSTKGTCIAKLHYNKVLVAPKFVFVLFLLINNKFYLIKIMTLPTSFLYIARFLPFETVRYIPYGQWSIF